MELTNLILVFSEVTRIVPVRCYGHTNLNKKVIVLKKHANS
jgi:hypothetical protein